MRKSTLVAAGALALPLVFSLPAVAAGLMERAQDEGMRQAQEASRKQLGADQNRHDRTNGAATTGAAASVRIGSQAQSPKSDSDDAKGQKQ
jgi:hypothetical protein